MTRLVSVLMLASIAAAAEPQEILLWQNGAPGSEGKTGAEVLVNQNDGVRRIAGIHKPSLTVYLPGKTATGAAVIIAPGGGHRYLSIDNEGHAVAKWLAEHGVAGFVLKYRLAREEGSTYTVEGHAANDAQRAVRLVRSRAKEFAIDPDRIGLLGFSAGGQVAALAAVRHSAGLAAASDLIERESSRPAFQALVYSGSLPSAMEIAKDAPPAFICVASDDRGPADNSLALFRKFRDAGVSAELHVYNRGGHGFGMRERPLAVTSWPERFQDWLRDIGMLSTVVTSAEN